MAIKDVSWTVFVGVIVAVDANGVVGVGVLETTVDEAGRKEEETDCGECRWRIRSMLVKAGDKNARRST